jgi:hypothetical protein
MSSATEPTVRVLRGHARADVSSAPGVDVHLELILPADAAGLSAPSGVELGDDVVFRTVPLLVIDTTGETRHARDTYRW